jgi:hypothetical protein
VQKPVGFDCLEGLGEGQTTVEAEPSSRVPVPLNIKTVAAYPVQPRERAVELFAQILREAGSIALDEPVAVSMPFAENVDGVVELGGAIGWGEWPAGISASTPRR